MNTYHLMQHAKFKGLLLVISILMPVTGFAHAAEKEYASMPWHLADSWWNSAAEERFESLSIDFELSDDVPDSVNLYVAPLGTMRLNGTLFYGGIQTRSDGYTQADRRLRVIGRGLLMSMWDERSEDAIRPSEGGYFQSSGHEGDFVSVRKPFRWTKGRYTYRVTCLDRVVIDDVQYVWIGAFLHSYATHENIFIGALRFKGEEIRIGKSIANFVEIYGSQKPVSEIPKLTVTFYPPVLNGQPRDIDSIGLVYPENVPDFADGVFRNGALEIRVGEEVKDRSARQIRIYQKAASSADLQ